MKKIIDGKGRLFGIISIIDIIVIAVCAVLAAAVLLRNSKPENTASTVNTVPVTYFATIYSVRETTASLLRTGDEVYTNSGIYIGTIKDVKIEDSILSTALIDGTYVKTQAPERYNVTLTIEVQCSVAGGRYYADRTYELCASYDQRINTKYVDTSCTITKILVD